MARKCERPSCRERGEVAYVIDTSNLLVNIDAPIPRDSSRVNVLCRRHADSLVVPRDWQIIDNRAKKQRLFSVPTTQTMKSAPRTSRSASEKRKQGETKRADVVIQDLFDFSSRVVVAPMRQAQPSPEPEPEVLVAQGETAVAMSIDQVASPTAPESIDMQETQAMPWTPQFDRTGDLDGRLRARGKLLARAFGSFDDADLDHDQQHPED